MMGKTVSRALRVLAPLSRPPVGLRLRAWAAVLLLASSAAACTRAKAKTMPDAPPPLDVPAPPPRDVETNETEPPPLIPLPQEPARNAPPRTRTTQPARPTETRPEPPKPETTPPEAEAPKPEEAPKPPTLQTGPSQAEAEMERGIRTTLSRAAGDLNRVDYRVLNADARVQYDTAKNFIDQAEKAVRAKNLVFAKTLADKAAAIATQLGGK
jgi:outer membrane biosynthesis protein TonB